jgi:hypothetical protein
MLRTVYTVIVVLSWKILVHKSNIIWYRICSKFYETKHEQQYNTLCKKLGKLPLEAMEKNIKRVVMNNFEGGRVTGWSFKDH